MGVHVLTIGSETFISDLRIRPIKQQLTTTTNPYDIALNNASSISLMEAAIAGGGQVNQVSSDDYKLTWNLEIRRLKKDDTAFYYCVLNSENAYGQIYKLNVLGNLAIIRVFRSLLEY